MSSLFIALGPGVNRNGVVVPHARPRISGDVDVTASSAVLQIGGTDVTGGEGEFWFLTARSADIVIAVGDAPTAGTDPGHLCPTGTPMAFPVNKAGEKIAAKNA